MNPDTFFAWSLYAASLPFLAIVGILCHYALRRALIRRRRRTGKGSFGFYPSAYALGMAFQFVQVYTRPGVAYVLEEKQKEELEEDSEGDPETIQKQLGRQLRRIRRGDPIDRLVLRI
jgi:hypothetical protein